MTRGALGRELAVIVATCLALLVLEAAVLWAAGAIGAPAPEARVSTVVPEPPSGGSAE